MIHRAKDLSPDQRFAIESLVGRPVSDDESVSVRAFEPPAVSDQRREEIARELEQYFAEVDAHHLPATPEEAESILNEALRSVRPLYRPRR